MTAANDHLCHLLGRLQLTTLRDQLDTLLDDAARRDLNLREALTFFCQAEVARREQRRLDMATRLAKFPWVRTLDDFDFTAQPTLEPKHLRELALCRWVGNGDGLLLLGPHRPTTYCSSTPCRSDDSLSLPSFSRAARYHSPPSSLSW